MVTCKVDTIAVPKMNSVRSARKAAAHAVISAGGGSNSSGFRLLDGDQLETSSSVSRNSVYKLKIDLMFDDTRSVRSNRLDDPRGSHRTRSIIMYGRSELESTAGDSSRSLTSFLQETNEAATALTNNTKNDVQRISNSVQAQIEQLFTDVAKDATSTFAVTCLGSLPLKDKVTSLQGLQEPLKELYIKELANEQKNSGFLDICATGLRIKINAIETGSNDKIISNSTYISSNNELNITPFHNIAVWSAVKFVISEDDNRAAFLPLITDPDNIDKAALFQPLSPSEKKLLTKSKTHAPIFAVVMRSAGTSKILECHGFICRSTEDAIVIAATLYQSLMAHVGTNSHRSTKRRTPKHQNGVSCISIASSSAVTGSNYLSRSQNISSGRKSSFRSSSVNSHLGGNAAPTRSSRKKRISNSSLSSSSNVIKEAVETTTEERKRKSHKTKRAPPIPAVPPAPSLITAANVSAHNSGRSSQRSRQHAKKSADSGYRTSSGNLLGNGGNVVVPSSKTSSSAVGAAAAPVAGAGGASLRSNDMNGDILTRVAIPRSGSFLNTGGLTRYKSRAAHRPSGKLGGGGGGGSPLGFSELFNEFRLHENLNSLDEILNAIIDADGMSFNDLKPIYKEFLLKLAVTLTKDELFQRSKNIMRRQKKKKLKRRANVTGSQKKPRTLLFGAKNLKRVFQFGQFRSCRGKPAKPQRNKEFESRRKSETPITIGPQTSSGRNTQQHRSRIATSGSDVSVVRNDNGLNGPHRNSSSGYVSCSECSYDSEACTCTSADRCYCSLRDRSNVNNKLRRRHERNAAALSKKSNDSRKRNESSNNTTGNRSSYISCKSDDKCYCSMVEEEPNIIAIDDDSTSQAHSDTTWCDTDSCLSTSKCYCKRSERPAKQANRNNVRLPNNSMTSAAAMINATTDSECTPQLRNSRPNTRKPADKLALDYELFTISGSGKSVQPDEALSMKKSVEAAAIFADVKLSQTTDIKTLFPPPPPTQPMLNDGHIKEIKAMENIAALKNTKNHGSHGSCRSYSSSASASKKHANQAFNKRRDSYSNDRKTERNSLAALSSNASNKSCSADDLLSKLSAIEKAASVKSGSSNKRNFVSKETFLHSSYQSMRAVSASLEDTLGYLP